MTGQELKSASAPREIVLGGNKYEIAFDMNAICDLEDRYGSFEKASEKLSSVGSDFSKPGVMKELRFLLCVMLRHTDENMTEKQAGRLLTLDTMQEVVNALGLAMGAAAPAQGKNVESPRKD